MNLRTAKFRTWIANLLSKAEMSRGSEWLFAADGTSREVEAIAEERRRNHRAILLRPVQPITGAFSQLGAPYLLQHYNSPGGHFRPIKPASWDSTFSLCPLLMPQTSHSVISTLVTNALLSLISLVDSTIGGDNEGIGKKHPVAFPASSSVPLRPR